MQPSPPVTPPPPTYPLPFAPWPPPPPRANPWLIVLAVLGVAALLAVASEFVYLAPRPAAWPSPYPPSVIITDYGFNWQSPPSSLCDGWSSNEPWVPFIVSPGAQFDLDWTFGCWNDTGSYVIDAITSVSPGFSVVWSNLPVTVVGTRTAYFNVTLSAPSHAYNGSVDLWITAHAV